MLMDNLQNSPDVDDCSGSVHTLLLETSVTPIIDQPAPTLPSTNPSAAFSSSSTSNSKRLSPPRRQYSSESNDSTTTSPEKNAQQKQN